MKDPVKGRNLKYIYLTEKKNNLKRVLIVDDEKCIRDICIRVFNKDKIAADTVGSAEEGQVLIENNDYSMVILDIILPGKSGISLLEKIMQENPEIKVIMITGASTKDETEKALRLGAQAVLLKPFGVEDLRSLTRKVLE